jgi:beta-N-acetylhexosaminidase
MAVTFAARMGLVLVAIGLTVGLARAATLEQMAGQMILVGFVGTGPADPGVKAVIADLRAGGVGGVMVLKTNLGSAAKIKALTGALRTATDGGPPPFIAIDQEGGAVARLGANTGFPQLPNAETEARTRSVDEARSDYAAMAEGLAQFGFNLNFAPVLDLKLNPDNPVIARFGRSFSRDAGVVTDYARALIEAHRLAGVLTALKHFPGHGSSTADSHEGIADITATWRETELAPYRQLINEDMADMVMIGHLVHFGLDPSGQPASLSGPVISGLLRDTLGFPGVVISDDLEMGAIRKSHTLEETVVAAVEAGTDILLFSNTLKPRASLADEVRAILVNEAEANPDFRARIEASYARIMALKDRLK